MEGKRSYRSRIRQVVFAVLLQNKQKKTNKKVLDKAFSTPCAVFFKLKES